MSVEKTLNRLNERIQNQEFYEAHQAVRTIVARYSRKKDYSSAIGMLYNSALLLIFAGQQMSAVDLLFYLLKVYEEGKINKSKVNKGRLAEIAWHIDPQDPVVKQVAKKSMEWAGLEDEDLANVFGTLFIRGSQLELAESYLLRGTRASAVLLANQHLQYSKNDETVRYKAALRAVLGYLSAGNTRNAFAYLEKNNFDDLKRLADICESKDTEAYKRLDKTKWEVGKQALVRIEDVFFGIKPAKQFNLMDMFMR